MVAVDIAGSTRQRLREGGRGELPRPGDTGYDAALRLYNGMIEKRLALSVHPA